MDILDELYYGNINPFECHTDRNPECRELQGFIEYGGVVEHLGRSKLNTLAAEN